MRIEVTAGHIARGKPKEPSSCPIAIAVMNEVPGATSALAAVSWVTVYVGGQRFEANLPREASDFVLAFDRGQPVATFLFDLDIPEGQS